MRASQAVSRLLGRGKHKTYLIMSIAENIKHYQAVLPRGTRLIAVSKTKPVSDLQQAYDAGQRLFGENKAQEMRDKHAVLPKDIEWHFIGHLQINKVKYVVPIAKLIHSVDSLKLLCEINKAAIKCNKVADCLLQVKLSQEETKYGFDEQDLEALQENEEFRSLENVRICGLMGIGSVTEDLNQTKKEFEHLSRLFKQIKERYYKEDERFCELSMGMSHDYQIAVQEGSTLVRIGSSIFGLRNYAAKS